ncbi:MAG: dTMP kinase [Minisyncoccales bacterium]
MKRGIYIMLEGGEGCGKDTQAKLLEEYLLKKGYEVINTKEPGGTPEAEQIRNVLLKKENNLDDLTELFLYQAARKELNNKIIKPSIENGKIVISRRGFPSTFAYQGYAGGVNPELIEELNKISMHEIFPDLLFIIDIDPETGLKKETNPDRFAAKKIDYHNKVRQGYLKVAEKYPHISMVIPYQEGNLEKMQEQIRHHLKKRFNI